MSDNPVDSQAIVIGKPAEQVFAFIADPSKLDRWSFGTWRTRIHADGLVQGVAIFDGAEIFVRIDPLPERLLIDYHIGTDPAQLQPRIFARITPGAVIGEGENTSVLTLAALRSANMPEPRWQRLIVSHAFELQLLKSLLESGYDHRAENLR